MCVFSSQKYPQKAGSSHLGDTIILGKNYVYDTTKKKKFGYLGVD